jgi:hypothetical protein
MNVAERRVLIPLLKRIRKGDTPDRRMTSGADWLLARLQKKPDPRVSAFQKRRKEEEAKARAAHNAETARIREACVARAGSDCECGCGRLWAEMDHFYGRSKGQSVETCWMLSRDCHRAKTENRPTRAIWDATFQAHCLKHGYPFHERKARP